MTKNRRHEIVKVSMYKTAMCALFSSGKGCSFGDRCAFAHSMNELRPSAHDNGSDVDAALAVGESCKGTKVRCSDNTGAVDVDDVVTSSTQQSQTNCATRNKEPLFPASAPKANSLRSRSCASHCDAPRAETPLSAPTCSITTATTTPSTCAQKEHAIKQACKISNSTSNGTAIKDDLKCRGMNTWIGNHTDNHSTALDLSVRANVIAESAYHTQNVKSDKRSTLPHPQSRRALHPHIHTTSSSHANSSHNNSKSNSNSNNNGNNNIIHNIRNATAHHKRTHTTKTSTDLHRPVCSASPALTATDSYLGTHAPLKELSPLLPSTLSQQCIVTADGGFTLRPSSVAYVTHPLSTPCAPVSLTTAPNRSNNSISGSNVHTCGNENISSNPSKHFSSSCLQNSMMMSVAADGMGNSNNARVFSSSSYAMPSGVSQYPFLNINNNHCINMVADVTGEATVLGGENHASMLPWYASHYPHQQLLLSSLTPEQQQQMQQQHLSFGVPSTSSYFASLPTASGHALAYNTVAPMLILSPALPNLHEAGDGQQEILPAPFVPDLGMSSALNPMLQHQWQQQQQHQQMQMPLPCAAPSLFMHAHAFASPYATSVRSIAPTLPPQQQHLATALPAFATPEAPATTTLPSISSGDPSPQYAYWHRDPFACSHASAAAAAADSGSSHTETHLVAISASASTPIKTECECEVEKNTRAAYTSHFSMHHGPANEPASIELVATHSGASDLLYSHMPHPSMAHHAQKSSDNNSSSSKEEVYRTLDAVADESLALQFLQPRHAEDEHSNADFSTSALGRFPVSSSFSFTPAAAAAIEAAASLTQSRESGSSAAVDLPSHAVLANAAQPDKQEQKRTQEQPQQHLEQQLPALTNSVSCTTSSDATFLSLSSPFVVPAKTIPAKTMDESSHHFWMMDSSDSENGHIDGSTASVAVSATMITRHARNVASAGEAHEKHARAVLNLTTMPASSDVFFDSAHVHRRMNNSDHPIFPPPTTAAAEHATEVSAGVVSLLTKQEPCAETATTKPSSSLTSADEAADAEPYTLDGQHYSVNEVYEVKIRNDDDIESITHCRSDDALALRTNWAALAAHAPKRRSPVMPDGTENSRSDKNQQMTTVSLAASMPSATSQATKLAIPTQRRRPIMSNYYKSSCRAEDVANSVRFYK